MNEISKLASKRNPEPLIRAQIKYRASEKGKILNSKCVKKWQKNNSDYIKERNIKHKKKQLEELPYSYLKGQWIKKHKDRGLPIPEFTGDIYIAERIRIYTIRQINESKQRIRDIIPDNARNS